MTQTELARRAKVTQPQLVSIESGKTDPQFSTLQKIFAALSCRLHIVPEPVRPMEEVLRGRARAVALKRLKHSMGTMSLEGQAPEAKQFRELLEKRTDEILMDKRVRLSGSDDE